MTQIKIKETQKVAIGRLDEMRFNCKIFTSIQKSVSVFAGSSLLLYQWIRQKLLYSNSSMQAISSLCLRITSWVSLGMITCSWLVLTTLLVLGSNYTTKVSENSCGIPNPSLQVIQSYAGLVSNILNQIVLLVLFIYPLLKHRVKVKNVLSNHESKSNNLTEDDLEKKQLYRTSSTIIRTDSVRKTTRNIKSAFTRSKDNRKSNRSYRNADNRLLELIKRCCFLTTLCIMMFIIADTLRRSLVAKYANIGGVIHGLYLMTLLITSIFYFKYPMRTLFPFCYRCKKGNNLNTTLRTETSSIR